MLEDLNYNFVLYGIKINKRQVKCMAIEKNIENINIRPENEVMEQVNS